MWDIAAGGPAALASGRVAVWLGLLGVLAFSFTLPATRVAVEDLDATFVGLGRAVVAAALAGAWLAVRRDPWPTRSQWRSLAVVVGGVVLGFPLLTALALRDLPGAHSAVIVGVLPAATAVAAVVRAVERPSMRLLKGRGELRRPRGRPGLRRGPGCRSAAARRPAPARGRRLVPLGYAEGAVLTRDIGGLKRSRGRLIALPVTLRAAVAAATAGGLTPGPDAWLGFAYVAGEHVPRLFRLVRGPGARRGRQDRPGPARAAPAHPGPGRALLGGAGGRARAVAAVASWPAWCSISEAAWMTCAGRGPET